LNSVYTGQYPSLKKADTIWRALILSNLIRLGIAGLFVSLYITDNLFPPLASHNAKLFFNVSLAYGLMAIFIAILNYYRRPAFDVQAYLNIYTDIIAITLLMHASGGVSSGLGTLMVISIGGGSIIMGGRHALLFASISTIAVLLEEIFSQFEGISHAGNYIHAGVLGITFFVTAILTHIFAKRIRETEALAQKRGIDLANMADLTEHIIQRMQTGVLVVDSDNNLRFINESAWHMLGMPATYPNKNLSQINPELAGQLNRWKGNPERVSHAFKPSVEHASIMPRFARISSNDENPASLVYLEDTSDLSRQAQQLQLASLGRLTASIAHEIRNPLGAISHAGQLLAESAHLDSHDQRLIQIISDHSKRVNTIIENILQLGRRDSSHTEVISLKDYLEQFRNRFLSSKENPHELIHVQFETDDINIRFDTSHLEQILTNLCENALRYSKDYPGFPKVEIQCGVHAELNRPYMDIIDHGPGIKPEDQAHIFEPFFTTSSSGTGLGLYLSRELAECNQAQLNYIPAKTGGSCFRITFQDPRRHMN
jgi:two-component system sensor histidine kinase PilS (NtrC family)